MPQLNGADDAQEAKEALDRAKDSVKLALTVMGLLWGLLVTLILSHQGLGLPFTDGGLLWNCAGVWFGTFFTLMFLVILHIALSKHEMELSAKIRIAEICEFWVLGLCVSSILWSAGALALTLCHAIAAVKPSLDISLLCPVFSFLPFSLCATMGCMLKRPSQRPSCACARMLGCKNMMKRCCQALGLLKPE